MFKLWRSLIEHNATNSLPLSQHFVQTKKKIVFLSAMTRLITGANPFPEVFHKLVTHFGALKFNIRFFFKSFNQSLISSFAEVEGQANNNCPTPTPGQGYIPTCGPSINPTEQECRSNPTCCWNPSVTPPCYANIRMYHIYICISILNIFKSIFKFAYVVKPNS